MKAVLAPPRDEDGLAAFYAAKVNSDEYLPKGMISNAMCGLILGNDAGFKLLICQLAAVKLGQPMLDEVSRDGMAAFRIARAMTSARISWQSCSLNSVECRRQGLRDVMSLLQTRPVQRNRSYGPCGPARGVHSNAGSILHGNQQETSILHDSAD